MSPMKILLALGGFTMAIVIAYGFIVGNFFQEARLLFPAPWFQVTLIDLYMGFFLFSGWILFRERSRKTAVIWIVLLLTLGNLASCAYALLAAAKSRGNWHEFWLGYRATKQS